MTEAHLKPQAAPTVFTLLAAVVLVFYPLLAKSEEKARAQASELPETTVGGDRPELEVPPFEIPDGHPLSHPFQFELDRLHGVARVELSLLQTRENQQLVRASKMAELLRRGLATPLQLEEAQMQLANARDRLEAEREYLELANRLRNDAARFRSPVQEKTTHEMPYFQVRIPGLTLRMGGQDFFTARMMAHSRITDALIPYMESRLRQQSEIPHHGMVKQFLDDRGRALSEVASARATEFQHLSFQQSMIQHSEQLSDLHNSKLLRDGKQLVDFHQNLESLESGQPGAEMEYGGADRGFWLLGDGRAVAAPGFAVTDTDLVAAGERAQSTHTTMAAMSQWKASQQHYEEIAKLFKKGYSGDREMREAALGLEMARLEKEKAKALQKVTQSEYEQMAVAQPVPSRSIFLPQKNEARHWHNFFKDYQPLDREEVIHFLEIAKRCFEASAERSIGQRALDFRKKTGRTYEKIRSVRAVELAKQRNQLAHSTAEHAEAHQEERMALVALRQWVGRNSGAGEPHHMPPQAMEKVIQAGLQVIESRLEAARLEWAQRETHYLFDLDHLKRLLALRKSGSANDYEITLAYNQARRSRGDALTAMKHYALLQQEGVFNKALFGSGSMSYSEEKGLEIVRWMPEAIAALKTLVALREDTNPGQVLHLEADLADLDQRIAEINRLITKGYGSKVEVQPLEVWKKNTENRIAVEANKNEVLKRAMALVQSFERPEGLQERQVPVVLNF